MSSAATGILAVLGAPRDRREPRAPMRMPDADGATRRHRTGSWTAGDVTLAQHVLITVPEQETEQTPIVSMDGAVTLVYEGRIDNRDEVVPLLRRAAADQSEPSDGALLVAAYERWGDGFPTRLAGDFAVAIWDARRRALIGARDHLGGCTLFYAPTPNGGIVVGSRLEAVLVRAGAAAEPDERFLDAWLAGVQYPRTATPYRGVQALPRASIAIFDRRGVRVRTYWSPRTTDLPRFRIGSDAI